jgi:hypothetical protein
MSNNNQKRKIPSGYPTLAKHLIQKSYKDGVSYEGIKTEVKSKYGVDLTEEDYIAIGEYEDINKPINESESNGSDIIKSIIIGIVIIMAMKIAGKYIWKAIDTPDNNMPTIQSLIKKIELQEKAKLPQKVAENIYVVDIKTTANSITYINQISGTIDKSVLNNKEVLASVKAEIAQKLCNIDVFKYILNEGGWIIYKYQLSDGKPFTSINIMDSDCI